MLKVHFTEADLAKVTIAEDADPMWELLMSSYRIRRPEGEPFFGRWRRGRLEHGRDPVADRAGTGRGEEVRAVAVRRDRGHQQPAGLGDRGP
ncbi:hypothetical protein [Amycolatopsis kentuckyensis]|uniref:hypothetical protein n=1 Tax=Amycolatopsis kentuckyensis TaxID=218823 RepID=UPI001ABEE92D|nr:hypothetical protein [Amycolatopsis kentuckyensis]